MSLHINDLFTNHAADLFGIDVVKVNEDQRLAVHGFLCCAFTPQAQLAYARLASLSEEELAWVQKRWDENSEMYGHIDLPEAEAAE